MRVDLGGRCIIKIKGEMRNIPLVHYVLRRSGSRFVERHEPGGSRRDARQIVKDAVGGVSLGFFPEGTFSSNHSEAAVQVCFPV